jgi:glycosyltransferase involved in cell wall biosynthesis
MESASTNQAAARARLVCFVNGIFGDGIGGGDIYFAFMVRAALAAGYPVHAFGGHAFQKYLEKQKLPVTQTLTDAEQGRLGDVGSLGGQFRLLFDFRKRLAGTTRQLDEVREDDIAYAMSDYWFDTIPLMRCKARAKVLYLGMIAPTLGQVLTKGRPDVTGVRLPSLYYWMSQRYSLRRFLHCPGGIVTYSHPEMRDYLRGFGYDDARLVYVPNGSDTATADRVPDQPKLYDVVWTGRVHPQKGVKDLLATLGWLKQQLPNFRGLIIGKSQETLEPVVREMGLAENVTFSGLVSEEEKFRLLKCSRVFVMPSRYESWGIVVGEAIVSGVPVVGYRLSCYPPVFGDFVRYVEPFDSEAFQRAVEDEVRKQRAGQNYMARLDWQAKKKELSWTAAGEKFCGALERVQISK